MPDFIKYKEDILKQGFDQYSISLKDDYEGKVRSTLVRRLIPDSGKAVLYIHGFNDYFFQKELAFKFNKYGLNFYALDLRKYGRSYLPHQKFNDIRNLKDYYEEILYALDIMRNEGNKEIILVGHSTGGLIVTLFAKDYSDSHLYNGIILNSPFYDFNLSFLEKNFLPILSLLGKIFPTVKIPGGFSKAYGKSIHKDYDGEWNYNLNWKPNVAPHVNLGWIRAIYEAQKELKKEFHITGPVLVMHSLHSITNKKDKNQIQTTDIILDINQIDNVAKNIKGDVEIIAIKNAIHDLVLSHKPVREYVYNTIYDWLTRHDL
jgi:alpha-beta hydrolase superfamily lysophospholipase